MKVELKTEVSVRGVERKGLSLTVVESTFDVCASVNMPALPRVGDTVITFDYAAIQLDDNKDHPFAYQELKVELVEWFPKDQTTTGVLQPRVNLESPEFFKDTKEEELLDIAEAVKQIKADIEKPVKPGEIQFHIY